MTTLMDSSADADAFCSAWWLVMGTSNRIVRCSPGSSSLPLSQFLSFCSALFPLLSFTVSVCLWYYHATMLIGQQQQQQMNKMSDCVLLAANGLFTTTLSLASLSPVVAKRRDFLHRRVTVLSWRGCQWWGKRCGHTHTEKKELSSIDCCWSLASVCHVSQVLFYCLQRVQVLLIVVVVVFVAIVVVVVRFWLSPIASFLISVSSLCCLRRTSCGHTSTIHCWQLPIVFPLLSLSLPGWK